MTMVLRRLVLTTHVTSSVGWAGAVFVFLALAAVGLTSPHEPTVRGAYLVMAPAAWFVLVPLAHASLLSGIAISLGTPWGLLRYHWVVAKLAITLFATVILLVYTSTFRQMAGLAADPIVDLARVRNPSPMAHAILALVLLLVATVLAIYKPFGMTAYGRRTQREGLPSSGSGPPSHRSATGDAKATSIWGHALAAIAAVAIIAFVMLHLFGGGIHH
jgi:hypothetical protein